MLKGALVHVIITGAMEHSLKIGAMEQSNRGKGGSERLHDLIPGLNRWPQGLRGCFKVREREI